MLAAVGLTIPGVTRIQPWLVPSAAVGIMIVMVCATVVHLARGELTSAATTVVLLALATFVALMRWRIIHSASKPTRVNRGTARNLVGPNGKGLLWTFSFPA